MTAIAYKNGTLAADTAVGGRDSMRGHINKIAKSPAGTLGAAAGYAGAIAAFDLWIAQGAVDRWIDGSCGSCWAHQVSEDSDMFEALIVTTAGRVIHLDHKGRAFEYSAPFEAAGCAVPLLTGALAAGASAEEAVRIAIEYDDGCGGEVQVERLPMVQA